MIVVQREWKEEEVECFQKCLARDEHNLSFVRFYFRPPLSANVNLSHKLRTLTDPRRDREVFKHEACGFLELLPSCPQSRKLMVMIH
ncbi:hypothetical protein ACOSQ3_000923 [Xanthoceras sorbifolium]